MAPQADKAVKPPDTLPPDFFEKQQGSGPASTLPANFDFGDKPSAEPQGNALQRSFDTETQTSPNDPLLKTGLKSVVGGAAGMFVHPWETAKGVGSALVHSINPADPENPLARGIEGIKADYQAGGLPYALTKAVGSTFGNVAGGAGMGAGLGIARDVGGAGVSALRNFRPTPSPEIVPPIQTAAEKLAGSIVPKAKQIPGFVNDIQRNAGNIRDYVQESGNPLKTQAEFEKAVQGAGNKRYEHFTKNILGPIADQPIEVPEGYGGKMTGQNTAKLGDIHGRIARINQLTSPAYAKANPGDVASELAKRPMESLQAEHAALNPVFQNAVADATGIPAEDIANLRRDFGSLRGLGNTVTEARAGRIAKVGAGAEGSTSPQLHASPFAFINQGIDVLRGGRTAIADRALQRAWKGFEPLAGEGRQLPQSPEGFQAQKAFQQSANQEAATAEATRMHQAEMAAQDAAAARGERAQGLRQSRRATAEEGKKLEGEAARTIGRRNVLNQRSK